MSTENSELSCLESTAQINIQELQGIGLTYYNRHN